MRRVQSSSRATRTSLHFPGWPAAKFAKHVGSSQKLRKQAAPSLWKPRLAPGLLYCFCMNPNLHVTYRHIPTSEALTAHIETEAQSLAEHFGHPLSVRVTIEPARPTAHAKRCRVHIEATVPGDLIVANRRPSEDEGHDDAYLAVREAFRALRRQLDSRNDRRRAERHAS
jgi:ribosome-associated translation inhibitor RaiA